MDSIADLNTYDLKPQFDEIKSDLQNVKSEMVTKLYLDRKIADLSGEFVIKLRTEDEKIEKITEKLGDKKVFNSKDVEEIKSIKVFAKVA